MPLVPSKDQGSISGFVHSHRFAAANTAVPTSHGDAEQVEAVENFLRGALSVDIFALAEEPAGAEQILRLASGMFSVGLRLAMPALALLLLVDVALALLGRLNQQLQLLMLAFPVKMMAAIALLAALAVLFPHVYRGYSQQVMSRVAMVAGF